MKLMSVVFIIFLALSPALFANNSSNIFNSVAKDTASIMVKDLSKNKTIYARGSDKLLRPASLTKIMTCMLAIESGKMNNTVTITRPMVNVEPTIVGLKVGDKVKLKDLVHAALIRSANDAANSIAYYLGNNNKEKFMAMMNKKAKRLGMKSTNFVNPCGFDHNKHKSTARDLMKLAEYAIKNKYFNSVVKRNMYTFRTVNTNKKFAVYTSNKLQRENRNVVGLKTGYTSRAGACLIAHAKKDKKDILFVMLDARNRWPNAQKVLNETLKSKKKLKVKRS